MAHTLIFSRGHLLRSAAARRSDSCGLSAVSGVDAPLALAPGGVFLDASAERRRMGFICSPSLRAPDFSGIGGAAGSGGGSSGVVYRRS